MSAIPGYLTTEEAAVIIGRTPARVRQIKSKLGGLLVGGALMFPEPVVRAYSPPPPGRPVGAKDAVKRTPQRKPAPAKGKGRRKKGS